MTVNDIVSQNLRRLRPPPGVTCPLCLRAMEPTPLEVWLAQNGQSFDSLAAATSEDPEVRDFLEVRRRDVRVSKNLVWRLNHQAPGFVPRASSLAASVLPAMLRITGLQVADLQNERPTQGGYACGDNGARS